MSDSRKPPSAAFWATVAVLVVLVAYPLSAGPVYLIEHLLGYPEWLKPMVVTVYTPIDWVVVSVPTWARDIYLDYLRLWLPVPQV